MNKQELLETLEKIKIGAAIRLNKIDECIEFIRRDLHPSLKDAMCRICGCYIIELTVARKDTGEYRRDIDGNFWCQECTDKFDTLEPK